MNCSNPTAATTAADLLPATADKAACNLSTMPEPEAARKLLLTAAMRQHLGMLWRMVNSAYLKQYVDAPTLAALLLQLLVAMASGELHVQSAAATMDLLCELPAAAELTADSMVQLMHKAAELESTYIVATHSAAVHGAAVQASSGAAAEQ
jgi:hypothetical protein